ncbi:hypothetical protein RCL_jg9889.t1 [Rhizophagus clarus]|uniref:Uncharacterized protein n=1 Tax=Rhizophagus clarus TaxID=94130 RepID=A0A8H3QWZ9_9GLOM|nr:hypothetical protein RCL_jg9889.t1 [Rhizophagus clarus]
MVREMEGGPGKEKDIIGSSAQGCWTPGLGMLPAFLDEPDLGNVAGLLERTRLGNVAGLLGRTGLGNIAGLQT